MCQTLYLLHSVIFSYKRCWCCNYTLLGAKNAARGLTLISCEFNLLLEYFFILTLYFTKCFCPFRLLYFTDVVFLLRIVIYFTDAVLSIRIGTYFTDAVFFIRNMIYFTDVVLFVQIVMYFTDVVFLIRIVMHFTYVVFLIRIVMYFTDVVFFIRIVMYFTDVDFSIRNVIYFTSVSILIVMLLISVVCFSSRLRCISIMLMYPSGWWYISLLLFCSSAWNRIGGVMVCLLASSVVDRGFEPRAGLTKYYEIGMRCFSAEHSALRRKSKDWLVRNQDTMSKWGDMSILGLLFQWASTIKIQLSVLV